MRRLFLASSLLGGSYDWAMLTAIAARDGSALHSVVERARVDVYLGGGLEHLIELCLELVQRIEMDEELLAHVLVHEAARRHSCFAVAFK